MRRALLLLVSISLFPAHALAQDSDIFFCVKDGREWMVTRNRLPPKPRRCKLVLKGDRSAGNKVEKAAVSSGKPKAKSKKRWKPPHTVYWKKSDISAEGKLKDIDVIIKKASETYNIPEAFIRGVIEIESSYKVKALSYKGAMGLMQLMPGTAGDMGVTDAYDPFQNVMGGTKFLRILANRFNGDIPKVLAAYHAGGRSVSDAGGIPFQGSDGYVRKVLKHYYRIRDEERTAVRGEQ